MEQITTGPETIDRLVADTHEAGPRPTLPIRIVATGSVKGDAMDGGIGNLDAVGRTALVTAAMRAAESGRPDALCRDPFAGVLAADLGPALLAELLGEPSAVGQEVGAGDAGGNGVGDGGRRDYNALRTLHFDSYLSAAARRPGVRQIVVVGAGMDARPYRLDWPRGVRYFEVDRPAVLAYKRARLAHVPARADHRMVAADLASPSWPTALTGAGFEPGQPSAWLMEGLLPYLPEDAVHRLLDAVAHLAAPRSEIAADLVNTVALTAPEQQSMLAVFARWGCPWVFACDRPGELFAGHGFAAEVAEPADVGARLGRWSASQVPPDAAGVMRVFLVTARRVLGPTDG